MDNINLVRRGRSPNHGSQATLNAMGYGRLFDSQNSILESDDCPPSERDVELDKSKNLSSRHRCSTYWIDGNIVNHVVISLCEQLLLALYAKSVFDEDVSPREDLPRAGVPSLYSTMHHRKATAGEPHHRNLANMYVSLSIRDDQNVSTMKGWCHGLRDDADDWYW